MAALFDIVVWNSDCRLRPRKKSSWQSGVSGEKRGTTEEGRESEKEERRAEHVVREGAARGEVRAWLSYAPGARAYVHFPECRRDDAWLTEIGECLRIMVVDVVQWHRRDFLAIVTSRFNVPRFRPKIPSDVVVCDFSKNHEWGNSENFGVFSNCAKLVEYISAWTSSWRLAPSYKLHSWPQSSSVDSGGVYSRSVRLALSLSRAYNAGVFSLSLSFSLSRSIGRKRERESERARARAGGRTRGVACVWNVVNFSAMWRRGGWMVTSVMSQQCTRLGANARAKHERAPAEASWVGDTRVSVSVSGSTIVGKMPATRPPRDRPLLLLPLSLHRDELATVRGVSRRTIDVATDSWSVPGDRCALASSRPTLDLDVARLASCV